MLLHEFVSWLSLHPLLWSTLDFGFGWVGQNWRLEPKCKTCEHTCVYVYKFLGISTILFDWKTYDYVNMYTLTKTLLEASEEQTHNSIKHDMTNVLAANLATLVYIMLYNLLCSLRQW